MTKIIYPEWKIALWRLVRVFVAGFIAQISIDQILFGTQDIQVSLLKAGVAGGLAAIAKWLRDTQDLEKLPI